MSERKLIYWDIPAQDAEAVISARQVAYALRDGFAIRVLFAGVEGIHQFNFISAEDARKIFKCIKDQI